MRGARVTVSTASLHRRLQAHEQCTVVLERIEKQVVTSTSKHGGHFWLNPLLPAEGDFGTLWRGSIGFVQIGQV